MTRKRKIKDLFANSMIGLASFLVILILGSIMTFIIVTGKDTLTMEVIRSPYWSQNYLVSWENADKQSFERPESLGEDVYFSKNYGVAFEDTVLASKEKAIKVVYIDEKSPFNTSVDASAGENLGKARLIEPGNTVERIEVRSNDVPLSYGRIFGSNAQGLVEGLDSSDSLSSMYFKTTGGGIWGSIQATLYLIVIALVFAFPFGLGAAIYLNEYAPKNKVTTLLERSIELLAGIPSIIFGLMGVTVLYPIVAFFNITGLSILLGGMTLAVILLPVIIRTVQESLLVVPQAYRSASLSLGATQTQTVFKVVVPNALPGILSALLLSISRIIGESAALIYTAGTFINDMPSIRTGGTSLSVHIWTVMGQEQPNFELAAAISIIIMVIVLILNMIVRITDYTIRKRSGLI